MCKSLSISVTTKIANMKSPIRILILLLLSHLGWSQDTIKMFLMAGQSNMQGYAVRMFIMGNEGARLLVDRTKIGMG